MHCLLRTSHSLTHWLVDPPVKRAREIVRSVAISGPHEELTGKPIDVSKDNITNHAAAALNVESDSGERSADVIEPRVTIRTSRREQIRIFFTRREAQDRATVPDVSCHCSATVFEVKGYNMVSVVFILATDHMTCLAM